MNKEIFKHKVRRVLKNGTIKEYEYEYEKPPKLKKKDTTFKKKLLNKIKKMNENECKQLFNNFFNNNII